MKRATDKPYCKECGYLLVGLTESSKCPECGRPIVEVLVRDSFPGQSGYRYESETRLFGLPLVSIASGPHGGESYGKPVGIIAMGDAPRGVIALGGRAFGALAVGGVAVGGIAFGGLPVGLISFGGCALGILALGGAACGLWAFGGAAFPFIEGWGGRVIYLWPW